MNSNMSTILPHRQKELPKSIEIKFPMPMMKPIAEESKSIPSKYSSV